MSFFRYPGGKAKLSKPILSKIQEITQDKEITDYIEPFFGGGSIGLAVLESDIFPDLKSTMLSEFDFALFCLWVAVYVEPEKLTALVKGFNPTTESFYAFKDQLVNHRYDQDSMVLIGFKKLAIHQMSYSGLGVKAGGPIGGAKQTSKYDVGCRWSPDSISKKIAKYSKLLNKYDTLIHACDFAKTIELGTTKSFIYVDPPYYDKGSSLYQFSFDEKDHERLANSLKSVDSTWLLSYDDCPQVRDLYQWAEIEEVSVNYTITTVRTKNELLIYPKQ